MVVSVIQARMGSSRLPGKTMMKILNRPVLDLLIERLGLSKRIEKIIVATTTNHGDDVIEKFCEEKGIACFRGSSDDVLNRIYSAATRYKADTVVEVTGDCPLVDSVLIDECLQKFAELDCDYMSNFMVQTYPAGIDVQIFKLKALEAAERNAKDKKFREHVPLYMVKHPKEFKLHNVEAPSELHRPEWHLEIDEAKDFELLKKIFEHLYPKDPRFTSIDIIRLLDRNPEWMAAVKDVKRVWKEAWKDT